MRTIQESIAKVEINEKFNTATSCRRGLLFLFPLLHFIDEIFGEFHDRRVYTLRYSETRTEPSKQAVNNSSIQMDYQTVPFHFSDAKNNIPFSAFRSSQGARKSYGKRDGCSLWAGVKLPSRSERSLRHQVYWPSQQDSTMYAFSVER